jgi:hypothetical protein
MTKETLLHHFKLLCKVYDHKDLQAALDDARWGDGYTEHADLCYLMLSQNAIPTQDMLVKYKYAPRMREVNAIAKIKLEKGA